MTRLVFLALLTLTADPPRTAPPMGLRVNLRDLGARPGPANAATTRSLLQAAIDAPLPSGFGRVIHIPADPLGWYVDWPVFLDKARVEIEGDGKRLTVLTAPAGSTPIVVGVQRTPAHPLGKEQTVPDASHWPDLVGVLDRNACPQPKTRHGYRTKTDTVLSFPLSEFTIGPVKSATGWKGVSYLRMEFGVDLATLVNGPDDGNLFGIWSRYTIGPWAFTHDKTKHRFGVVLKTLDGVDRFFFASDGGAKGPTRVSWQIDLKAGAVQAWVNGDQKAIDVSRAGKGWKPGLNQAFADRDYGTFQIGCTSARLEAAELGNRPHSANGFIDITIFGLKACTNPAYKDLGPGKPQTRIDGQAVHDASRFFLVGGAGGDELLDALPFTKGPNDPQPRVFPTYKSIGLMLSIAHGSPYNAVGPNAVRHLALGSASGTGAGLLVGLSLNLTVDDVETLLGVYGIASLNLGPNYPGLYRDLTLRGTEASFYSFFAARNTLRDIFVEHCGRRGFHLVGHAGKIDGVFVPDHGNPEHIFLLQPYENGGMTVVEDVVVDFEGGRFPSVAGIEAWSESWVAGSSLTLRHWEWGTIGPDAYLIRLRESFPEGGGHPPSTLTVEDIKAGSYGRGFLRNEGHIWRGHLRPDGIPADVRVLTNTAPDGRGGVTVAPAATPAPAEISRP